MDPTTSLVLGHQDNTILQFQQPKTTILTFFPEFLSNKPLLKSKWKFQFIDQHAKLTNKCTC